jgi:putative peptidoglycan lipid II flippase
VLGGLETPLLLRFLLRMVLAAGIATAFAWAVKWGLQQVWEPEGGKVQALSVLAVTGVVDVALLLVLARALRIKEVTGVMALVTGRLRR